MSSSGVKSAIVTKTALSSQLLSCDGRNMRRSARAPSAAAWPDAIDVEDGSCDSSTEYIDKYEKHDAAAAASCSSDAAIQYSLLALGLFTRYYSLLWPRQVVFDEVHFGKFVNGYITGRYFFDIHPPLGKQLIALRVVRRLRRLAAIRPHWRGLPPACRFIRIARRSRILRRAACAAHA